MATVNIIKKRVLSLNIFFERDFAGGEILSQSNVNLTPIVSSDDDKFVFLAVNFEFSCDSITDEFKLKAAIVLSFSLENRSAIKKEDLYSCIEQTKEHLQNILKAIFAGQKNVLIVAPIALEDVDDMLNKHIHDILK